MFTGIIESIGTIASFSEGVLRVQFPAASWEDPIQSGESIAVNGCCLTVVKFGSNWFTSDLSPETLERTSFGAVEIGLKVNLERAMGVGSRFGGHIVQGHVDGLGQLVAVRDEDNAKVLRFSAPLHLAKYLVDKCSIAIDGISLTVVMPQENEFEVWVIPHTWTNTNLSGHQVGDSVNLEIDLIARYVEKLMG